MGIFIPIIIQSAKSLAIFILKPYLHTFLALLESRMYVNLFIIPAT